MNPIIPSDQPVTVPPVEAKTFDALWLYSLTALMPSSDAGQLSAEFIPVNSTTGDMLPEGKQTILVNDLPKALAEIPELQAAFAAIVMAVGPVKEWLAAQALALQEQQEDPSTNE